jgi:hypothetical protein
MNNMRRIILLSLFVATFALSGCGGSGSGAGSNPSPGSPSIAVTTSSAGNALSIPTGVALQAQSKLHSLHDAARSITVTLTGINIKQAITISTTDENNGGLELDKTSCTISTSQPVCQINVRAKPSDTDGATDVLQISSSDTSITINPSNIQFTFTTDQPPVYSNPWGLNHMGMGTLADGGTASIAAFTTLFSNPSNIVLDSVFRYEGFNGDGDPGLFAYPTYASILAHLAGNTNNLLGTDLQHSMRPTDVVYTGNLSGDASNITDFSNVTENPGGKGQTKNVLAKHFETLALTVSNLLAASSANVPTPTIIVSPDSLGSFVQQKALDPTSTMGAALSKISIPVTQSVEVALCSVTHKFTAADFSDTSIIPNGAEYYATSTDSWQPLTIASSGETAAEIHADILSTYFWGSDSYDAAVAFSACKNTAPCTPGAAHISVGEAITNYCVAHAADYSSKLQGQTFGHTLVDWAQAQNWLIKTIGQGRVKFGWQVNLWAPGSAAWVHQCQPGSTMTACVDSNFTNLVVPVLKQLGIYSGSDSADFLAFDKYETDPIYPQTTFGVWAFNKSDWDAYMTAVKDTSEGIGGVSNPVPIMLWQIPGAHMYPAGSPLETSGQPMATAVDYFFGVDAQTQANLSGISNNQGLSEKTPSNNTILQHLKAYQWPTTPVNLNTAFTKDHVFAILWGGGSTTVPVPYTGGPKSRTGSALDDGGYLYNKINTYYKTFK